MTTRRLRDHPPASPQRRLGPRRDSAPAGMKASAASRPEVPAFAGTTRGVPAQTHHVRPSTTLGTSGREEASSTRFAGYAAVFNQVDAGGDVVRAGAFARTLRSAAGVPLLWEHDALRPIGRVEYVKEDRRGLRVIGRVLDPRAAALLNAGAVSGLSFGYKVRAASGERPRELRQLDLVEVSLVTFPMQPRARVHMVAP